MDHVIEQCNLPVFIGNEGEAYITILRFINILSPFQMLIQRINTYRQYFYIAFCKFILEQRRFTKFRCTNGRKVSWVRKYNTPAIAEILIKIDLSFSGLCFEIRGNISESKRHKLKFLRLQK